MSLRKSIFCVILLALLMTLPGCTPSISDDFETEVKIGSDHIPVKGVSYSPMGKDLAVDENGAFYIQNGLLSVYDFDTGKTFALCNKPNCRHKDSECSAFIEPGTKIYGYACYKGTVYYLKQSQSLSSGDMELIRMDIGGGNKRTLATLPAIDTEEDEALWREVYDVGYAEDYLWMHLRYTLHYLTDEDRPSQVTEQLVGIELDTGKVIELTDVVKNPLESVEFVGTGEGCVAYKATKESDELPTFEEYLASIGMDVKELDMEERENYFQNEYSAYCEEFKESLQVSGALLLYDTESKETTTLWEGEYIKERDADGHILVREPAINISGFYKGNVIYSRWADDTDNIYIQDLASKKESVLIEIADGGLLARFMGEIHTELFEGKTLYYIRYIDEKYGMIGKYDLETGENTELFRDIRNVTFRIVSETSDKLIGEMNYGEDYYWIDKEEFEKGNLEAAVFMFKKSIGPLF